MATLHHDVRLILADRHSPAAAAIFRTLLTFVERRVRSLARTRCRGLLSDADVEEILGEVLFQLAEGGLGRFRGETMPELLAYVRTMADRTAGRRASRRLREREAVSDLSLSGSPAWHPTAMRAPDELASLEPISPLDRADRSYLEDLVRAGSKATLARQRGVSRAAVTQHVQRILGRVDALHPKEQATHEAWLHRVASDAIDERMPLEEPAT